MLEKKQYALASGLNGDMINIPYYKRTPTVCNKIIYIQSGMHGGEVTIRILKRLLEQLIRHQYPNLGFILVPLANPMMWEQHMYYATLGKFSFVDGLDPNRSFPGNISGSLSQKIAHSLTEIADEADVIIDLHTSRESVPFGIFHSHDIELINILGLSLNQVASDSKYHSTLSGSMSKKGKVAFTVECGSHDEFDETKINTVMRSLDNYFQFLSNKTISNRSVLSESTIFTTLGTIYSAHAGFIEYIVHPGTSFKKDDPLGSIILATDLLSPVFITAPSDGIVLKRKKSHIVRYGDEVFQYIPSS